MGRTRLRWNAPDAACDESVVAAERGLFRELIRGAALATAHRASVLADAHGSCAFPDLPRHLDAIQDFLDAGAVLRGDCITVRLTNSLPSALTVLALLDGGYGVLPLPAAELKDGVDADAHPARFSPWTLTVDDTARATRDLARPASFLQLQANPDFRVSVAGAADGGPRVYFRTSGSLGVSKLAVHRYATFHASVRCIQQRLGLDPSSRVALPLPIFHSFALGTALLPGLAAGASVDLQPRANVLSFFDREDDFNPNVAFVTPTFCETLVRARRAPRPYRFMLTGGDCTSEHTRKACEALHGPLLNAYGSTEMLLVSTALLSTRGDARAATAGTVLPGIRSRLVPVRAEDGTQHATQRELQLRSPFAFAGYVDAEGEPLELPAAFEDGWFRSRDLARVEHGNLLRILGRSDLSVNRAGRLVAFAELEAELRNVADVAEVAIVRGAQDIRGQHLAAFCVLRKGAHATSHTLRKAFAEALPSFVVPDSIHILDQLPRLPSGKIDRTALATLETS